MDNFFDRIEREFADFDQTFAETQRNVMRVGFAALALIGVVGLALIAAAVFLLVHFLG